MTSLCKVGKDAILNEITKPCVLFVDDDCEKLCDHLIPSLLSNQLLLTIQNLSDGTSWISEHQMLQLLELKRFEHDNEGEVDEHDVDEEEDEEWDNNDWNDDEEEDEEEGRKGNEQKVKSEIQNTDLMNVHYPIALLFISKLSPENESRIKQFIHSYKFTQVKLLVHYSDIYHQYIQSNVNDTFMTYSDMIEKLTLWTLGSLQLQHVEISEEPIVTVRHLPFNYRPLTDDVFLIPSCSEVFPSIDSTLSSIASQSSSEEHDQRNQLNFREGLPIDIQSQYTQLAHALKDFCELHSLQPEIYSIGNHSHFIAETMQGLITDYPSSYNTIHTKTSFFILDRTLDLVAPLCYSDNVLDKINSQNAFSEHSLNSFFFNGNSSSEWMVDARSASSIIYGAASNGDENVSEILQVLLNGFSDQVQLTVCDVLMNLLSHDERKKVSKLTMNKPQLKQLQILFDFIVQIPSIVFNHLSLLQFISIIVEAMKRTESDQNAQHMFGIQSLLLMEAAHDLTSLLNPFLEILKKNSLSKDLFKLLIIIYSILPPKSRVRHEELVKNELVTGLLKLNEDDLYDWFNIEVNSGDEVSEQPAVKREKESDEEEEDEDWGNDDWDDESEEDEDKPKRTSKKTKKTKPVHNNSSDDDESDEDWDNDEWDDFDPFAKKGTSSTKTTHTKKRSKSTTITTTPVLPPVNNQKRRIIEERLDHLFIRLTALSNQRNGLTTFKSLIVGPESTTTPQMIGSDYRTGIFGNRREITYEPLLKQLIGQLSDQESCLEISDIRHNKSLLRSLSSTFGRFMFQSKPKLITDDCSVIVIFVVGGITGGEISDMRRVIQYHNVNDGNKSVFYNRTVMIASNLMTNSETVFRHFILQ